MPVSDIVKEIFNCFFHALEYRPLSLGENQVDAIGKLDRLLSVNTSLAKVNRRRWGVPTEKAVATWMNRQNPPRPNRRRSLASSSRAFVLCGWIIGPRPPLSPLFAPARSAFALFVCILENTAAKARESFSWYSSFLLLSALFPWSPWSLYWANLDTEVRQVHCVGDSGVHLKMRREIFITKGKFAMRQRQSR